MSTYTPRRCNVSNGAKNNSLHNHENPLEATPGSYTWILLSDRSMETSIAPFCAMQARLLLFLFLLLIPQIRGASSMFATEEMIAFQEVSSKLLENMTMEFTLGLHGEFIFSPSTPMETSAFVLSRGENTYEIAVFDFPNRYFFARINPDLTIQYNFEQMPPTVPISTFCGPKAWPFSDNEKKALFPKPSDTHILCDYPERTIEKFDTQNVIGYGYLCLGEYTYILTDTTKQSPYAMPLIRSDSGNMDLLPSKNDQNAFLRVVNGGWDNSHIIFFKTTSGAPLEKEKRLDWPFHDDTGSPSIPSHLFLSPLRSAVTKVWVTYDSAGNRTGVASAPTP